MTYTIRDGMPAGFSYTPRPKPTDLTALLERLQVLVDDARATRSGLTNTANRLLGDEPVSTSELTKSPHLIGKLHAIVDQLRDAIDDTRSQAHRLSAL